MGEVTRKTYTPEQRAEALKLHVEVGPGEAARRMQIPMKTIASWARRAGVQMDAPTAKRVAVEMAKLTREQKREKLREALLDKTISIVEAIDESDKASAIRDLTVATKNLVETFRLEVGDATARTETMSRAEKEQEVARLLPKLKSVG